jgi:ubiquinone/menaquinone biosynthesis C-methylase UbiE
MSEPTQDKWAEWLLNRRHGGDPNQLEVTLDFLRPVRERVLTNAAVKEGDVVLDVGTGDGLIAFGALDLAGERGRVIFSDVSEDLLAHTRTLAGEMEVLDRCAFLLTAAEDLGALDDASVDVVTTRSVLIYVEDKLRAFEEFHRVLRPGGRLSIFEPINIFGYPEPAHLFRGYDVTPVQDLARKVSAVYERIQPPDTDPMLNFDERDLLAHAERAGFGEIHLTLEVDISPGNPPMVAGGWENFVRTAGNPKIPTLEEAMDEALTQAEAERFEAFLRPLVDREEGTQRYAVAYLWAVKR